eukprot:10918632-Alexandrium_andersonii.AAC.1
MIDRVACSQEGWVCVWRQRPRAGKGEDMRGKSLAPKAKLQLHGHQGVRREASTARNHVDLEQVDC